MRDTRVPVRPAATALFALIVAAVLPLGACSGPSSEPVAEDAVPTVEATVQMARDVAAKGPFAPTCRRWSV